MRVLNASQIRSADQIMIEEHQFPGLLLMETAGRKSAEFLLREYPTAPGFLVLAGPGNNGGDGLVIARYLSLAQRKIQVVLSHSSDRYRGDAATNFKALSGANCPLEVWEGKPPQGCQDFVLVDALLGTGINDLLRGPVKEIIDHYRNHSGPVVAIDLPSGLSADHGKAINPALIAQHTLSFQSLKLCHCTWPAAGYCGQSHVLDIGIWPSVMDGLGGEHLLLQGEQIAEWLGQRQGDGHKGSFGHALLLGGSPEYPGAIALAAHAALHTGVGLSTLLGPASSHVACLGMGPEAIVAGGFAGHWTVERLEEFQELTEGKALGIGPGLGLHRETGAFVEELLQRSQRPLVLDADALNHIAKGGWLDAVPAGSVLTPHPGEMRRLFPEFETEDRLGSLWRVAAAYPQLVWVLKGAGTLIAHGDQIWICPLGNAGMATGGSGDVLTGICTGLLAQGLQPSAAAAAGVWIHALAGDLSTAEHGQHGTTASRIIKQIGKAIGLTLGHASPKISFL